MKLSKFIEAEQQTFKKWKKNDQQASPTLNLRIFCSLLSTLIQNSKNETEQSVGKVVDMWDVTKLDIAFATVSGKNFFNSS